MKNQIELNRIPVDIDYYDVESIVRGFLTLSSLNRTKEFSFRQAFDYLSGRIIQKLIEHAQCGYDEFVEMHSEYYNYNESAFDEFTIHTDYMYISTEDVRDVIYKLHYEQAKHVFDGMFGDLIEIRTEMENCDYSVESDMVILFDRVIHAEHVTGDIFDEIDIDDIKADLDQELIELMGITL